jgi:(p)ppGpp synthase/HD superfamily hydrolase
MDVNIWPYIELSRYLIKKERKGLGNMFRHQFETFVILLEYGYEDPVLLKAALIHDLFEDGHKVGFSAFETVISVDTDGQEVYNLVTELSIRVKNGVEEPKERFLERIMQVGSQRAKILKLADRLSNINSMLASHDVHFIKRYLEETNLHILPYAEEINKKLALELRKNLKMFEISLT